VGYGRVHDVDVGASLRELQVRAVGDSFVWAKLVAWSNGAGPSAVDPTAKPGAVSFSQPALFAFLFPDEAYMAHTAAGDVDALLRILQHSELVVGLGECVGKLFISLEQHLTREGWMAEAWERVQGGYGRTDLLRGLCTCKAVRSSRVTPASNGNPPVRRFFCSRLGYWDSNRNEMVGGPGCAKSGTCPGAAFRPGTEPAAAAAARRKKDNGVLGACTCESMCATATCPCKAASKDCGPACHAPQPGAKRPAAAAMADDFGGQKCRNFPAGQAAVKRQRAQNKTAAQAEARAHARA
jgi:hypothetical protein